MTVRAARLALAAAGAPAVALAAMLVALAAAPACGEVVALGGDGGGGGVPPTSGPGSSTSGAGAGSTGCEGKRCGAACALEVVTCADQFETTPTCGAPAVLGTCDAMGFCASEPTPCPAGPCEGRGCGETCDPCAGAGPGCAAPDAVHSCDDRGVCVLGLLACPCDPDGNDCSSNPCLGAPCGTVCNPCPPDQPNCAVDSIAHLCDGQGKCVSGPEVTCTSNGCEGAPCGAPCDVCDSAKAAAEGVSCVEPPYKFYCDGSGQCLQFVGCSGYDPCGDKPCGAGCTFCDPNDPTCAEPTGDKTCRSDGTCQFGKGACADPCFEKLCGEACDFCDPGDPSCVPAVGLVCDVFGNCGSAQPFCEGTCAGLACGVECKCDPAVEPCSFGAASTCNALGQCSSEGSACP